MERNNGDVGVLDIVLAAASEVFDRAVTADDDFYELGGDSICAVEIAVAVETRVARPVDAVDLLDSANFAEFATRVSAACGAG